MGYLEEFLKERNREEVLEDLKFFEELLLQANKNINLTRITDEGEMEIKHYLDSLLLVDFEGFKNGKSLADIGSGAGFPGIPLKLYKKEMKVDFFESVGKKANFIGSVIEKMDLKDAKSHNIRAEEGAFKPDFRESYDILVSRAVASLPILLEFCAGFVKPGGYFVAYKGPGYQEEEKAAENAAKILKLELKEVREFELPMDFGFRSLLIYQKTEKLDKKYPRNTANILKKPL